MRIKFSYLDRQFAAFRRGVEVGLAVGMFGEPGMRLTGRRQIAGQVGGLAEKAAAFFEEDRIERVRQVVGTRRRNGCHTPVVPLADIELFDWDTIAAEYERWLETL